MILRHLRYTVPDGYTTNLVRYPIATLVYLPFILSSSWRKQIGRFWIVALLPTVVNVIGQTFFAIAPYYMGAGVMSFLVRVSVIWSLLLAFWLFPEERRLARSLLFWIGVAAATVGFLLMWLGKPSMPITVAGVLIVFLCSVFWALYDVTVRYTMGRLHPLIVFGVIGNYTSVGLIAICPLGEPSSVLHLDTFSLALLIASAYIGITIAHGLYYVALQRLGVAISAMGLLLTPFVSILGAAIFLHERFSGLQWLGGIGLTTGAMLALWSRYRMPRLPEPAPEPAID